MAQKGQLTKADYLPINEFRKLTEGLHADEEYFYEAYCILSFCTALRCSDVLQLHWKDVVNRKSFTTTEKKTGKARLIPINPKIAKKIGELYKLMGEPPLANYVFMNDKTLEPISIQYINRQIKAWAVKYRLKIDHFSTHTFRKTFGRFVYDSSPNKSESLILLNTILKHRDIETTKRYIGLRDDEVNAIFSKLNI